MKTEVKTNFKGLENLKQILLKEKKAIRIGILGSTDNRNDSLSNATLGAIHEFGSESKKIPARSFLRMPIEKKQKDIASFSEKALAFGLKNNKMNTAYNQIGSKCREIINDAFDTQGFGTWEPNKPMTIKRKGSSSPLIDSSQLRGSVTHDVINDK